MDELTMSDTGMILVTGHQGFLGSALVRALRARGANVLGLVNPVSHRERGDWSVPVAHADICDADAVRQVFAAYRISTVFHLAAQTLPTRAREDPHGAFEVNARGTWNVLEAARISGRVSRIVFSSTDSVYGENAGAAFDEASRFGSNFPYEASKACAEMAAQCYVRTYGLPIGIARFCNLYGPGDTSETRLVAGMIATVLAGRKHQLRGDSRAVRNYLYISDAVAALLDLCDALDRRETLGEAFNFCDETPYSVRDIVTHILRLTGREDLAPAAGAGTPGELSTKQATAAKAARILGWRPRVTLEEGLRETIDWHRARLAA